MSLRKATRKKSRIRLGLSATSGSGKTYSALLIAFGLCGDWDKVCIIDTENGSADLYEHLGAYNVYPLAAPYPPERYIAAIKECEQAGMEVIIIDSITHEWDGKGGCLEIVEKLGGKYQDWAKATPRHQAFIEAVVGSSCHIITTVRRKQDYAMTQDDKGKLKVEKAGLKEITRDGFEYELTVNLEMDVRHNATTSKDRTGLFAGKPEFTPTIETGKLIREWCELGIDGAEQERLEAEQLEMIAQQERELELAETKRTWMEAILSAVDLKTIEHYRKQLKISAIELPLKTELINALINQAKGNGFVLIDSEQKDSKGNPVKVFAQAAPKAETPALQD
jgi:hypothetical protein